MDPISIAGSCEINFQNKPVSAPEINAAYSQMRSDGLVHVPMISELLTIEEWRDRELTRISNA